MINDEFNIVGLYEHNADSYRKVIDAFDRGEDIVSIVHATGTGKSFNALQLAFDNKDKKIVYVVPSNGIIEHLKKIIEDNPNLDLKRDFSNLEFRTYQSLLTPYKEDRMELIDCDLLILDEFHHIGAPIWCKTIDKLIETHPNIKIFGMTAYTVRDRGTSYERDMADPDTDELFSGTIESRYDLCDAMIDGVLPKPIYKSAYTNLIGMEQKLEEKVQKLNATTKEYQEYMSILNDVKKRIQEAPSIPNILRRSIKPNGKYIYFCPPFSEDGVNDIETIKKQATLWFKTFAKEEDIIIYTSTSDMGDDGRKNRDAFYDDVTLDGESVDNKLRVMFAINQYNEGIHAPNIDGVIMGRGTTSDIVYFEQLGRALSVRGNTKEMFEKLEKYSIEELKKLCKEKDIPVKEDITKEELIEKLIAPVVIDLTNNYDFIKELENNLKDRIKNIQSDGLGSHRNIKLKDASFDIEIENQDLFEMLKYVSDRLTRTWEDMYEFARHYYEEHHNLEVPIRFKTNDGYTYDENGVINLGTWIYTQRKNTLPESEKGKLLLQIGMRFERKIISISWEEMYEYAKKYFEKYGNLEVPKKFKTNDGYEYDKNGSIGLGKWIAHQRIRTSPESKRGKLLLQIGMRFERKRIKLSWEEWYRYAKNYYEVHGNLKVPYEFKTNDGYTYDKNGSISLGKWIMTQREKITSESERGKQLLQIGMHFETRKRIKLSWEEMYEYAKKYYDKHGNLEVPVEFKTNDGYTYDENGLINLGIWTKEQRLKLTPESEKGNLFLNIGMKFEKRKSTLTWEEMYEYAKKYYAINHNLKIKAKFKTNDGYTYAEDGMINLGTWICTQRINILPESEKGKLLSQIGMIWNVEKNRGEINDICGLYEIKYKKNKNILKHISMQELKSKIEFLIENNISIVDENGILIDIFNMSSIDMKEKYGLTLEEMIDKYYIKKQERKGV